MGVSVTPNVTFAYDPFFPRIVSMTDGNGTTTYAYVPVGTPGALALQQESSPLASSAINYAFDALGRMSARTVTGSGVETFQYDAIGRSTGHLNDLGTFSLAYLGQTGQISSRQLTGATLATTWTYLPNSGDRRLAAINNVGLSSGQFSNYAFTTTAENFITGITETSDSTAVYPIGSLRTATYNNLNQAATVSGLPPRFDANGNLLSDGQRNYSWNAENRLVGITYPGQPGKQTAFVYDGLGRRTAISSIPPGGGSTVTTPYLWCGSRICQARNATNAVTRGYYDEGEFVPGSPAQPYYYGPDQLGSVRRAFATTSSAPAFSYDPYGNALQTTTPVTDFNYAGTFYNGDSGLYLTRYRVYDPSTGRWLSRDPIGENSDPAANLYAYVGGNPVSFRDPRGLFPIPPGAAGAICSLLGVCPPSPGGGACPIPPGGFPNAVANAPPDSGPASHDPPAISPEDNKIHGPISTYPDPGWSIDQLEDLERDLEQSINSRQDQINQYGNDSDPAHGERLGQEQQLLQQVRGILGR
jgi:RHS repeat-associated protein